MQRAITFFASLFLFIFLIFPAIAQSDTAKAPKRIITLDWSLTETILSLGVIPVGVPNIESYQEFAVVPPIPEGVVDVGLRLRPNLELIRKLQPDLILAANIHSDILHRLENIAPVYQSQIYDQRRTPLNNAINVTHDIAALLQIEAAGDKLIRQLDETILSARQLIQDKQIPPLYFAAFLDPRHVRLFAQNSLFQDVMDRIGLKNAWQGQTNDWGFAFVGIEKLHQPANAFLFQLEPVPPGVRESLARSTLWANLPFVAGQNYQQLPVVMSDGMVPSAIRFARLLTDALQTHIHP